MFETAKSRLRAADYEQLPAYAAHDLIQLIDGEVVLSMPPIPRHQSIVGEIFFLLLSHAKTIGAKAYTSPIEVYLDDHNIFEPDVLYLAPDTACQIGEKRLVGAPELVVEVLSPGTAKYDRQEKYKAYEQHGVREYWIVDPVHEVVEVWWSVQGQFVRQGVFDENDTFASQFLPDPISVKAIFAG